LSGYIIVITVLYITALLKRVGLPHTQDNELSLILTMTQLFHTLSFRPIMCKIRNVKMQQTNS